MATSRLCGATDWSADQGSTNRGGTAALLARIAGEGLADHPFVRTLADRPNTERGRNLADLVHLLCAVHGDHPAYLDQARLHCPPGAARDWLDEAGAGLAAERDYLARLAASIGPIPSTPGAAASEAALATQRHALEALAASERRGCALGGAIAFIADWRAIRPLLDETARLADIPPAPLALTATADGQWFDEMAADPACRRALGFGAEQLHLLHRALFDLLDARSSARASS